MDVPALHPRPATGRRLRVLAFVALGALALACGEPAGTAPRAAPEASGSLPVLRPLVRFRPEPGVRPGASVEMRWLGVAGEPMRAFVCAHDCEVDVDAGAPRGVDLEARAAVLPGGAGGGGAAVAFSVEREAAGPGYGATLWQASLRAGESRLLRVPFGDGPGAGGATLRLVVRAPPDVPVRAAWLEPRAVGARPAPPAPDDAPNIVLVTSDTTRQEVFGCYGGSTATPEVDRLAREGVLFENARSVAFGTNPSHASLMTSTPASRHGVTDNTVVLGPELPVLAEVLGAHGYATVAFVSAVVLTRKAGLGRGFDLYDDSFGLERSGDLTVSLFERWLREEARPPFFAWIHLYDPHQPYLPPDGRERPYLPSDLGPARVAALDRLIARTRSHDRDGFIDAERIEHQDPQALPDIERLARARYQGEVAFVDEQVGRIRAALEARGWLDRTVFVFTADHGENFLDRGVALAYDHAGLHRDVTRIPLVLRLPGGSAPARSTGLVSNLDLAPTLARLAGVPAPAEWTGEPLVSRAGELLPVDHDHLVLEGAHRLEIAVLTHDWLYRELREPVRGSARVQAVEGFAPGHHAELYALSGDPDERHDVLTAGQAGGGVELAGLRRILADFEARERPLHPAQPLDAEQLRALEALGYLGYEAPSPGGAAGTPDAGSDAAGARSD